MLRERRHHCLALARRWVASALDIRAAVISELLGLGTFQAGKRMELFPLEGPSIDLRPQPRNVEPLKGTVAEMSSPPEIQSPTAIITCFVRAFNSHSPISFLPRTTVKTVDTMNNRDRRRLRRDPEWQMSQLRPEEHLASGAFSFPHVHLYHHMLTHAISLH